MAPDLGSVPANPVQAPAHGLDHVLICWLGTLQCSRTVHTLEAVGFFEMLQTISSSGLRNPLNHKILHFPPSTVLERSGAQTCLHPPEALLFEEQSSSSVLARCLSGRPECAKLSNTRLSLPQVATQDIWQRHVPTYEGFSMLGALALNA